MQRSYIYLGVIAILALVAYLYNQGTLEGFVAPYYTPWWRNYYKGPKYLYKQNPYYYSSLYWWPYYGRPYFNQYWNAYLA